MPIPQTGVSYKDQMFLRRQELQKRRASSQTTTNNIPTATHSASPTREQYASRTDSVGTIASPIVTTNASSSSAVPPLETTQLTTITTHPREGDEDYQNNSSNNNQSGRLYLSPTAMERRTAEEQAAKETLQYRQHLKNVMPQRRLDQAKRIKEAAALDRRKMEIERSRAKAAIHVPKTTKIDDGFYARLMNCGDGKAVLASLSSTPLPSSRRRE